MSGILISGLINTETTVKVRQFPIPYYPIDYPFFGVRTAVSGVAYNIARALKILGDDVALLSLIGQDFPAEYIRSQLHADGLDAAWVKQALAETPNSVVLYDEAGRRQVYCDLKDIQEACYPFLEDICRDFDLVVACNTNFNRRLLPMARAAGVPIATDVHVLSDIWDAYDRDFLEYADILFLSDEAIGEDYRDFLLELARAYNNQILVLGRGSRGAAMYVRQQNRVFELPAADAGMVVNTVGAGDALFSGFIHYYTKGLPPLECLTRAQWFAAAKIRVSGASRGLVTEEELEDLMQSGR